MVAGVSVTTKFCRNLENKLMSFDTFRLAMIGFILSRDCVRISKGDKPVYDWTRRMVLLADRICGKCGKDVIPSHNDKDVIVENGTTHNDIVDEYIKRIVHIPKFTIVVIDNGLDQQTTEEMKRLQSIPIANQIDCDYVLGKQNKVLETATSIRNAIKATLWKRAKEYLDELRMVLETKPPTEAERVMRKIWAIVHQQLDKHTSIVDPDWMKYKHVC